MRRISSRSVSRDLGVERRERLVEQQHRGLDRQCPGQRHALLLAARELVRVALGEVSGSCTSSSISSTRGCGRPWRSASAQSVVHVAATVRFGNRL